jgi:putative endonuclease
MFYVYALYSVKYNKIYVGFTSDIKARLNAHNNPGKGGFTGRFQPWELIYVEECKDKARAMKREKELKTFRGRSFVRTFIK